MREPVKTTVRRSASRRGIAAPAQAARLCVVHPPELTARHALGDDALVIGRDPAEAAAVVNDATVSRRHVRIEWQNGPGLHFASDLGSRNGSALDGVALTGERRPLVDGSVLRVGDVLLVYEQAEALASGDAPSVDREAVPGEAAAMAGLRA